MTDDVNNQDERILPADRVRPTAIIGPEAPRPTPTEMALKEFHQSGVLWMINKSLLWDLGLSLEVEVEPLRPGEGENSRRYTRLYVRDHVPPTRIVDPTNGHDQWERFQRWLQVRTGRIAP